MFSGMRATTRTYDRAHESRRNAGAAHGGGCIERGEFGVGGGGCRLGQGGRSRTGAGSGAHLVHSSRRRSPRCSRSRQAWRRSAR